MILPKTEDTSDNSFMFLSNLSILDNIIEFIDEGIANVRSSIFIFLIFVLFSKIYSVICSIKNGFPKAFLQIRFTISWYVFFDFKLGAFLNIIEFTSFFEFLKSNFDKFILLILFYPSFKIKNSFPSSLNLLEEINTIG